MNGGQPLATVVVRTKNKADTIVQVLQRLRQQSVPLQIVVVDSGSSDATLDLAALHADEVLHLRPSEFSFGRALNVGASAAVTEFVLAVSAHTLLPDSEWVARAIQHLSAPAVAAVCGLAHDAGGRPLTAPYLHSGEQDFNPYWGFSNTSSCFKRAVWREHPFDEQLQASEDKEWARRVLRAGYELIYDPALYVPGQHRRREGVRRLFDRHAREGAAGLLLVTRPPLSPTQTLRLWWHDAPGASRRPRWMRLLSPYRSVEIMGRFWGERRQARSGHVERS